MNFSNMLRYDRILELQTYLVEMNKQALTNHFGTEYVPLNAALGKDVMYFQPLMLAPSDRKEVVKYIIGSEEPGLKSVHNRAANIFATFFFGPSDIYHMLSGQPDPKKAFVDFERVASDPSYVAEIKANIAYGRQHGFKLWTTTELHTSLQTEARNFCRIKHGNPERPATETDLIEWIASWIKGGQIDKVLEAKTLRGAYDAITSIRGVGPYYAGNPVMMLASLPEANSSHMEAFCAPGGGAIKTLEYLFDKKFGFEPAVKAIAWLFENQQKLMPELYVHADFQNMDMPHGKLWKTNQDVYTCNAFEVGLCQFSVYRKFIEEPEAIKRRLNPPPPNLEALLQRTLGNPLPPAGKVKVAAPAPQTATNLLSFDD
jgi:hypothetical protein